MIKINKDFIFYTINNGFALKQLSSLIKLDCIEDFDYENEEPIFVCKLEFLDSSEIKIDISKENYYELYNQFSTLHL